MVDILDEKEELFEEPLSTKLDDFVEYYFKTWFSDGVDYPVALFTREKWNHFDNIGPRTNNNGEAW